MEWNPNLMETVDMHYIVRNISSGAICGPNGAGGKYSIGNTEWDVVLGCFIFKTTDINIAFHYKAIMIKENSHYIQGYEIVEIDK